MAANAWAPWLYRCLPVTFLVNGRWDSPAVAVPAAIVVVGLPLAYSRWLALFQRDGERWPADPPGPPRTTAPPSTVERWSSGRSAVLVAVGLLVAIVVGTGAALLID